MANIQFNYLYRDGGNYKKYHSLIFSNPTNINLTELSTLIQSKLIDSIWFYADQWGLSDLRWEAFDLETDPTWHEFENINYTDLASDRLILLQGFIEFIKETN
jgi:hypothetical protein